MNEDSQNLNLRFLLWRSGETDRQRWIIRLSQLLNTSEDAARQLLTGKRKISGEQVRYLIEKLEVGIQEEDFFFRSLVELEGVDVVRENVRFLLGTLRHGEAKQLGVALSVSDHTISEWKRWRRSKGGIEKQHLLGLARYFGIDPRISLYKEPVFLWLEPVGGHQRREWLRSQILLISEDHLNELFPALRKLLKDE
jgi:hypothetical protein